MGTKKVTRRRARGSKGQTNELSRRAFLERASTLGATLIAAPLVLDLTGCKSDESESEPMADASDPQHDAATENDASSEDSSVIDASDTDAAGPSTNPNAIAAGAVLLGLYEGDGEAAARAAVAKLDFSWLSEGDTVLIKVASNSGNVHPAVTAPAGVRGVVAHLKELGAGRVIVADQAGVEWVRRSAAGRFSSTRERFETNGLIELEDHAELHFFDDNGFDEGYFAATLPEGHRWPRGMYMANIVKEADHIIYMPRLSQHTLAGITLSQKSAIGFIRDDSRHDLHNDAIDFYEKYTEINYAEELRSRTRLVINVSEKIHLHGGPDVGTVYEMTPTLVLASTSLANHDAVGASILMTLGAMVEPTSGGMTYTKAIAPIFNSAFAGGTQIATGDAGPWISESESSVYTSHPFEDGVTKDRAVQRGWSLSGGQPDSIAIVQDGAQLEAEVRTGVEAHGEGLYAFG